MGWYLRDEYEVMWIFDLGFCGVGKHSYKKAAILDCYAGRSNLSCAYASVGADRTPKIV